MARLLNNCTLMTGLGIYFEKLLFKMLGYGLSLHITESKGEVTLKSMQYIQDGELEMEQDIVYKLECRNIQSIDAYLLFKDTCRQLQSTKSVTQCFASH